MHGAFYLAKPGLYFFERVIWFNLLVMSAFMIFYWTSMFIERHMHNPLYMAIERDHVHWETFFPALTFCPHDKVNETALAEFIR